MASAPYVLSNDHYLTFGAIITTFARFERLVEITIHHALGGHGFALTSAAISGLQYQAKCDALNALLQKVSFPDKQNEFIEIKLREFNQHLALRNLIAHHVWKAGKRHESIKPLKVSTRGGKMTTKGIKDDETDYTIDELFVISNNLSRVYTEFADFLESAGALRPMAVKTAVSSAGSS